MLQISDHVKFNQIAQIGEKIFTGTIQDIQPVEGGKTYRIMLDNPVVLTRIHTLTYIDVFQTNENGIKTAIWIKKLS